MRFVFVGIVIAFCLAIMGCGTRPIVITTDDAVIGAQRSADKLQAIHDGLGSILQFHDSWIRDSIGDAIAGIDHAFVLLDEYDEFVLGLIRAVADLRSEIQSGTGQTGEADDSAGYHERIIRVNGVSEN